MWKWKGVVFIQDITSIWFTRLVKGRKRDCGVGKTSIIKTKLPRIKAGFFVFRNEKVVLFWYSF